MKTGIKILAVLLMIGCGGSNNDMIKKQIEAKKSKIITLQDEVAELEKQLIDSTNAVTKIAVLVKEIKPEEFKHFITVFGNVEADKYAIVSPEMSGQITKIHVEEGQGVSEGQLLVSMNNDVTESSLEEVKTSLEFARITFEKQETLWKQGIGSEIQYLQSKSQKESSEARLKMLEAQIRMSQVRAPFSGIVDRIYPKVGELAGPMTPVVEIVNLSRLTIKADVSEAYVGAVHSGEAVEISFSSLPDLQLNKTISRTSKVINPGSRTFQIELGLNNPGEKIRPNMISSIKINDFISKDALVVPSIVIKRDITGDYLYAVTENNKNKLIATKKYVKRGMSNEVSTIITEGLKQGDKVIVSGHNLVSTGSYVTIY